MLKVETKADMERLVSESIPESLTLDYKASPALAKESKARDELCKDVSALANSAGGQLIYGIEEKDQKPFRVDEGNTTITREWIEQVIDSNVQPRIQGLTIKAIKLENGCGYVISAPQSTSRGAHQAPDKKYYKRQNFQSVPMEDYEIRDIMRRTTTPDLETILHFDGNKNTIVAQFHPHEELSQTIVLHCKVRNLSNTPAHHVVIDLFLDADLTIPYALPGFRQVATIDEPGRPKLYQFRRVINSPPDIPVFQEVEVEQHTAQVAFQLPSSLLGSSLIYLETSVNAPGFSNGERWCIEMRGPQLYLRPPSHRLNK